MTTRRTLISLAAGLALLWSGAAAAQTDKSPIRLLVGLSPGGTVDVAARLVAERMSAELGRPVLVDNKPGAGQRLALSEVRRAAPDGRTLIIVTDGPFVINPHIYSKLDYTPQDFTPIAGIADFDMGLGVGPKVDLKDMGQFLAWARANAPVPYGSPGNGTLPHFSGVALGQAAKVEVTHVPYKGGVPAVQDLAAGTVPLVVTSLNDMMELHKAGRIRIIAVTGQKRHPMLPEVPTMIESGVNVSGSAKIGLYGPAGMPPALVKQLADAAMKAVNTPEVQQRLVAAAMHPAPLDGAGLAQAQREELKRLEPFAKASGYRAD